VLDRHGLLASSLCISFTLGFNGPDWTVDAGQRWLAGRHHQNAARTTVASATGLTS
jgi:hypothetical protein